MDIGNKAGQVEVLAGMAKTLSVMTRLGRVCDCKVNALMIDVEIDLFVIDFACPHFDQLFKWSFFNLVY